MAMAVLSPASATRLSIIPSTTSTVLPQGQFFLSGNIHSGWQIIQPILLTEERDDDGHYLISDDLFGVYGDGSTAPEALEDYVVSLIDYYEILSVRAQEDDDLIRAQLYRLRRYVRAANG